MKRFTIFGLLAVLMLAVFTDNSLAQVPDCSGEGPDRVGLVWSNGEFSISPGSYVQTTGTLYIFNPSGGDVRGWELGLDFPPDGLFLINTQLHGQAINVGSGNDFIVGLSEPLLPDNTGAVAVATFTFLPSIETQMDFYAIPTNPASIPDNLALLTGSAGNVVPMYPIGGAGQPIANLYGPPLDYCEGAANIPPTAANDTAVTDEDLPVTFSIAANDDDSDGTLNLASIQFVTSPSAGGVFDDNGNGTVTYTPPLNYSGADSLLYTIADNDGAVSNQASITVTIAPVDDPPVAVTESSNTDEDTSMVMDLAGNDYDIDSPLDAGSIVLGTPTNGGTLVNHGDGTVTFSPANDYFGLDTFSYTIADEAGVVSAAVIDTVYIASINDAPVALPDSVHTFEDEPITFSFTANDYDIDGPLDLTYVQWANDPTPVGEFVDNGDGTVTYTPPPNFSGTDQVAYAIPDEDEALSNFTTITVVVDPVDDIPVAVPENGFTDEDLPVVMDLAGNDYDIDSELDIASLEMGNPANGGNVLNNGDGTVTFTPAENFFGFDTFSYTIADIDGVVSAAVVDTVFITSINDLPVALPDSVNTLEDVPITFSFAANDYDIDGTLDLANVQFATSPTPVGEFIDNGDGTVTYTPPPEYSGTDRIAYSIPDSDEALSNLATITVVVDPVDDPPVAVPENGSTVEDVGLTMDLAANDYDIDSPLDVASIALGTPESGGTIVSNGDGTVTYTPADDYFGFDVFSYTIADISGVTSNAVTDTVFITGVNDLPVAYPDSANTMEDQPVSFDVLANDIDVDGTIDPSSFQFTSPSGAGGSFLYNGDGTITYTPPMDYFGIDNISYQVSDDSEALSLEQVITVNIESVNDVPIAQPENGFTDEDVPVVMFLTENDDDVDTPLDLASLALGTPTNGGSVVHNGEGSVTFTPAANYFGFDTFSYTIADVVGGVSAAVIDTVFINSVNDAPVAYPDTAFTMENAPVSFNIVDNDVDIDGTLDLSSLSLNEPAQGGVIVDNGDGTVTYTPAQDYFGPDTVAYTIADNDEALSNEAVILVNIGPVDNPPVAVPENETTDEDISVVMNLGANDYDIDSPLNLGSIVTGPPANGGVVENHGDGTVTFTPAANYFGFDTFTYTIADSFGVVSAAAMDTVFITSVNDPPVAYADTATTVTGIAIEINFLANDIDIDGTLDPSSTILGEPSQGGSFVDNFDGTLLYAPLGGFTGVETCTYYVSDDLGEPCVDPGIIVVYVQSDENTPPTIGDIPDQVANLGQDFAPLDLNDFVFDDQDIEALTWHAATDGDLSVVLTGSVAQVKTGDPAWFGSETITFTATDEGGLSDSRGVIFTVNNGFDLFVEIVVENEDTYYAGTATGATDGFDPQFDRTFAGDAPPLQFDLPEDIQNYAFVRHLLSDNEDEVAATFVDEVPYDIPYNRYRPVPLGEFCIYECIWNEDTQQYDCGLDCQYEIEGGKFYSLIWAPGGPWANINLVEETDEVWLRADTRASFDAVNEVDEWGFQVVSDNPGDVNITANLQFNTSFLPGDGIGLKLWDATEAVLFDLEADGEYSYIVPGGTTDTRAFTLYVGTPGTTADTDGDGVPDDVDQCPGEDASFFDRDGDGCIDPVIGGRHVEYWAAGTFPLAYYIHETGAPGIDDGSDLTAVQEGFDAWTEIAGSEITVNYLGTTSDGTANAFDGINTVTFQDPEFVFPSGVIAVGLSTSYLEADYDQGIRPGQIIDTDMIFNPGMPFRTDTDGTAEGTYIKGVVTHEAGHMLGLSHSAVQSSTMFYVLPPDSTAASLETEDRLAMYKAYYSADSYAGTSHLQGTVTDGRTGEPISGAIVYAINTATGDTLASDFTLPADGGYHFIGLPDDLYNLAIHPLNGSSDIGYLYPGNINSLINGTADILFLPEYWDAAESSSDDPAMITPVAVGAGAITEANFITNIDSTGPSIVAVSPEDGATGVPISAAILLRCDEAIDPGSLVGNFNFSVDGVGTLLPGNASLVENSTTLAYVPTVNLDFSTTYRLDVGAGLLDLLGNPMGSDFTSTFTTESQPLVAMSNLLPRKGVAGSILVINGAGFSAETTGNEVTYGGVVWPVTEASPSQLIVQVPDDQISGAADVLVQRLDSGLFSNALSFTVLPPGGEAHGLETAVVDLFALPRKVAVSPDGDFVHIATDQGLSYVDVSDPSAPVAGSLNFTGGLDDLGITPDGQRIYAISILNGLLHRIDADLMTELDNLELGYPPQGLLIDPSGLVAYLATDYREIQIIDINETSLNFQEQVGSLIPPSPNLLGAMATDPAGRYLLALDGSGQLLIFSLETFDLLAEVPVMSAARDVTVDPRGDRAYVTDDSGYVSIVSLTSFTNILDIPTGGALMGADIDPMGSFLYAVNHQLDNLDVIDLRQGSPTYRTISTRLPQQTNPVDVELSPDGLYAYTIVEADRRLAINTVGAGPMLSSLSRRSGPAGAKVVLSGLDFTGGTVSIGGMPAVIERSSDTSLTIAIPSGAASGPVMVVGDQPGEVSNSIEFEVLNESPAGGLRLASAIQPAGLPILTGALAVASNDGVVAVGGEDGRIHLLDIDPASMSFNQFIGQTEALAGPVDDLVIAPDGLSLFAVTADAGMISQLNITPGSATFGGLLATVDLPETAPQYLAVSPDGSYVLASEPDGHQVHIINWNDATVMNVDLGQMPGQLAYHPAGLYAYVVLPGSISVLNMIPGDPGFGTVVGSVSTDLAPIDLDFSPDGTRCYFLGGPVNRALVTLDTADPVNPLELGSVVIPTEAAAMTENLVLSPAGDRALLNVRDDGIVLVDLASGDLVIQSDLVADGSVLGLGFASSGDRVFAATSADGFVSTFDFHSQQQMALVWGDSQTGQASQNLGSTMRVRVVDSDNGNGLAGVPVTFTIDTSGKSLAFTASPVFKPATMPATGLKKKPAPVAWLAPPSGEKDGGESLDDATVIGSLPYTDTGSTAGHLDDYDEACPSPSPGSPDVVYIWTANFTGGVAIDLCGSSFDTKVYVYAEVVTPGSPWACNDDFYDEASGCGEFVSLIQDMIVYEGTTYIIVIDGYGGDSGDYNLNMTQNYTSTPWGYLVTDDPAARPSSLTVGSDALGFAEVQMNLGLNIGERTVDVSSLGVTGSPVQFNATAVLDPADISFDVIENKFAPLDGSVDVAVTTAIQITFNKPVDPTSVTAGNFFLSADGEGTPLSAVMGFASGNTTASLTPADVLAYDTLHSVTVGSGIISATGEPLTSPQVFTFTTAEAPTMAALYGVNPTGATILTPVMLSGSGFSSDLLQNGVYFGGVPAVVTSAEPDFILTRVPLEVGAGPVDIQVTVGGQSTNILPFTVLESTVEGADEVVLRVPSGSSTRTATVSPDGAVLYAVAPEADLVIPVDLEEFETTASIPVGDMPWAISGHPDGSLVYVANRMSGDVSVIDTDPASPTYHQTIASVEVGAQPVDIIVTPAGDRVLVANEESQDLAVIDSDDQSASFNFVINRVPVGSSARTVTVTPDGVRIYLGTDEGYIVIGSIDYGVIRRVDSGSSVKTVTVSPDGALLVLVDTEGDVLVFDIAEGSPTEDQVVARVPVGSSVKTATVSPDGARLYAVMEEGDLINVYALDVGSSVGARDEFDPRPVTELVLLDSLTAGENPQSVVFVPSDTFRFFVPNAGDNSISVFDDEVPVSIYEDGQAGVLAGSIVAADSDLAAVAVGVRINIYSNETGELEQSLVTNGEGAFNAVLPAGPYTASMITPAGFFSETEERSVVLAGGETIACQWTLEPQTGGGEQRPMAWWKHQLAMALRGWGEATVDGPELCRLLDAAGPTSPVTIYQPPASGECDDSLEVAGSLFNFRGEWQYEARAKQQLVAVLLNVASSRLYQQDIVSQDGARLDQAVAYADFLVRDGDPQNDQVAWSVARAINAGKTIAAGVVASDDQNAMFLPVATHFHLDQNYPNPFNPECRIRFGVPKPGHVRLKIFDIGGRLVKTLVDEQLIVGTYIKVWDGKDNRGLPSASGVYFYKMEAGSFIQTRKMLLVK